MNKYIIFYICIYDLLYMLVSFQLSLLRIFTQVSSAVRKSSILRIGLWYIVYQVNMAAVLFSVFNHVIIIKNRNRSINQVKNLGYDRRSMYKQPRQYWDPCCFSFARYSQKCFTQIYRALYEEAILVPLGGVRTWQPYNNRKICQWVSLLLSLLVHFSASNN